MLKYGGGGGGIEVAWRPELAGLDCDDGCQAEPGTRNSPAPQTESQSWGQVRTKHSKLSDYWY